MLGKDDLPTISTQADESAPPEARESKVSSRDPYRTLFMRSADAHLVLDGERFVDCNEATVKMMRYERKSDLLETHPSELSPRAQPDGRASFEKANEMMQIALAKGSHRFEWEHKRADGEVFPVEVLLTAVPQGDRTILHVVWRDISERKILEEELRHAQKMEAVGKLAGGIAHDFNNLLMAIMGNCDLLDLHIQKGTKPAENLAQIRNAGTRAADLTRQLLAFSRKQVLRAQVLDLNGVITELDLLLHRLVGEDVALTTALCKQAVHIKADRGQLEQVLVNLVSNARDAMPNGGQLAIETRRVTLADDVIGVVEGLRAGHYAMLTVSDDGAGMDDQVLRRAFDPFFTTKPVGQGTGLGLSTVYGIVKQSGAEISIFSDPGRGTTVKIWFPVTQADVDTVQELPSEPKARGGHETILVAEDEALVAAVIADVLRDAGYHVLIAEDGAIAYEKFVSLDGRVDLLLSDVVMPNLSGPALVDKLKDAGFHPRILFASGYAANVLSGNKQLRDGVQVVEKPFSAGALLRKVRSVLDGNG
jgi:PAS domain S-box-containing protein